jgi:uncharacterized protein YbjT (DUF2867 family)
MKIFCTGASGYIGGSVAAHLIAAGHQVTGLVRSPEKAEAVRASLDSDDGWNLEMAAYAEAVARAGHVDLRRGRLKGPDIRRVCAAHKPRGQENG